MSGRDPAKILRMRSASVMSSSWNAIPRRRAPSRFSRRPVARLSKTVTSSPRSRSASTRLDPMNPAPPVTSARMKGAMLVLVTSRDGDGALRHGAQRVERRAARGGGTAGGDHPVEPSQREAPVVLLVAGESVVAQADVAADGAVAPRGRRHVAIDDERLVAAHRHAGDRAGDGGRRGE